MRPRPLRLAPLLVQLKVRVYGDVRAVLRAGRVARDPLVDAGALDLQLAALQGEDLGLEAGEVVGVVEGQLGAVLLGLSGGEADGEAVGEGDLEGVGVEGLEVEGPSCRLGWSLAAF